MPDLLVRDLDDELVRALQKRAVEHRVSTEDELRQILRDVLQKSSTFTNEAFAEHLLSPVGRVDDLPLPARTRSKHRDVEF